MIIRVEHFRQCGLCSRGLRNFFNLHKLDWNDFLKNGISEDKLANTKDAQALSAITKIKEAQNGIR